MDALLAALEREHPNYKDPVIPPLKATYPQPKPHQIVQTEKSPRDVIDVTSDVPIAFSDIANAVIKVSGIGRLALNSPRRKRHLVHWRNVIYFLANQNTSLSWPQIARFVGDRHHTTVMHGYSKVVTNWSDYKDDIAKVERLLNVR